MLSVEQRLGTLELPAHLAVRDWEVVLGQYMASLVVLAVKILLTGYFPVLLMRLGQPDVR